MSFPKVKLSKLLKGKRPCMPSLVYSVKSDKLLVIWQGANAPIIPKEKA